MVKEKYLPLEEPVRAPEPEKSPREKRKEKWDNFWFYYKKPFWIAVFIIAAVLIITDPFHPQVKADYTVGLITGKYWSNELQEQLCDALEPYGEDLNGDGQVKVEVVYYLLPEDTSTMDPTEMQAYYVKLMGDLESCTSMIYLCDNVNAKYYGIENSLFCRLDDYSVIPEGDKTTPVDAIGLDWQSVNSIGQSARFSKSSTKMYFCLRALYGTAQKYEDKYNLGKTMLERMKNNDPVNPELLTQVLAAAEESVASETASMQSAIAASSAE